MNAMRVSGLASMLPHSPGAYAGARLASKPGLMKQVKPPPRYTQVADQIDGRA